MSAWKDFPIIVRSDGSYTITRNGLPYHVPSGGEWAELHAEVTAYAAEHPDQAKQEIVHEPTLEELKKMARQRYTYLVQKRLDVFARTKTYDNIFTACTYATSTVPEFAVEGQYCVEARDATWQAANAVMNAVLAGERAIPAWEELEAELPVLEWPEGSRPDPA